MPYSLQMLSLKDLDLLVLTSLLRNLQILSGLSLLISQTPNDYPEIRQELKQLINEVNHIGVNINQIVHHHNYELYLKEDRQQLIAYMKKLNNTVKEVVVRLGNQ